MLATPDQPQAQAQLQPPPRAPHSSAPAASTSQPQPQPPQNGSHAAADERELPVVLQDLVPLSYLIDRVVAAAYSDLATLVETLPGGAQHAAAAGGDQARKRKIVDHVLNSRRQLVKLLVLARWSKEAHRLHTAINIVGFLAIQNHQVDRAVESLAETHALLARARVRNYDLDTAIRVLSTGSAGSLPASLTDPFSASNSPANPLTDQQVLDTLADLDRALLARLVLAIEPLPPALAHPHAWRIHDGRVTFRVPGMWEADFTFGGGNDPEDDADEGREWYLLAIRFLFRVKDARGVWSSTPLGPIKDHLLQLCNQELLRRPYLPAPLPPRPLAFASDPHAVPGGQEKTTGAATAPLLPDPQAPPPPPGELPILFPNGDSTAAPTTTTNGVPGLGLGGVSTEEAEEGKATREWDEKERQWTREKDEIVRKRKRDRPLDRGYTFLQRLALSYQLEAVHASATRLAATSWSGSLEVERRTAKGAGPGGHAEVEGEDEVRIHYWRPPAAMTTTASATGGMPGKPLRPAPTPTPSSSKAAGASAAASASPGRRAGPGGTIVFSLRPVTQTTTTSTATAIITSASTATQDRNAGATPLRRRRGDRARLDALQAALDQAAHVSVSPPDGNGADNPEGTNRGPPRSTTATDVPKSLSVTWLPALTTSAPSPTSSIPAALAALDLTSLLGSDLDVERVVRHVTALHARDAVERLATVVLAAPTPTTHSTNAQLPRAQLVYPHTTPASSGGRRGRPGVASSGGSKGKKNEKGEKEEEEDGSGKEVVAVPYLYLPLAGAHAIGAHLDPVMGRFELRVAPAVVAPESATLGVPGAEDDHADEQLVDGVDGEVGVEGGSTARDQRLRLASDRIDRERFGPALLPFGPKGPAPRQQSRDQLQGDPDAWIKGVVEVVARIRASTILDELDTLISLLSLPLASAPVRRLPLPPRELAKLGPNISAAAGRAAFLFVPLLANEPALAGWFLLFELFEDGMRGALLYTAERSDQLGNWTEILEVGWLGAAAPLPASQSRTDGEKVSADGEASTGRGKGANLGFEVKSEVLRGLWWHCVRRAAAFSLELQLHLRRIPYRRDPAASHIATAARLVMPTSSLLRAPDVEQLLRPDAELRCAVEEDGRRKSILLVYLRITPGAPSPSPPPNELPPSVLYNPAKGALVLLAEGSMADTVERLLRALAIVLKLVRAARPLGSPIKAPLSSHRLKMVKSEKP
ncbi:hypothetical protein JCM3774_004500 [Rhodotorula dairenensis]